MSDPIRVPIEAEIDLHAFSPRDIRSVVEEYVSAAACFQRQRRVLRLSSSAGKTP
jgi:hypothetical protein